MDLNTENAPPLSLPLKYILACLGSFLLLTALLWLHSGDLISYYRNPTVLGLTHLATLGWITMIIMGAAYQLIPVVLQVPIYSENIGHFGFYLQAAGSAGLVYSFFKFDTNSLVFWGALLLVSGYLFGFNIFRTVMSLSRLDTTAWWITAATLYFLLTITWGWIAVLNLRMGFLEFLGQRVIGFHALLGFVGWFTAIIIGVGYKLIPMFALAHTEGEGLSRTIFALLNAGIILSSAAQLLGLPWIFTAAGLLVAVLAIGLFLQDIRHFFEVRRRRKLDLTMKYVIASLVSLALLVLAGWLVWIGLALGLGPIPPRINLAIGFFGIMGWVSLMILGQLYKIVPFLVWYNRYSSKVGLEPVPLLKDMFDETWGHRFFGLFLAGLTLSTAGLASGASVLTSVGLAVLALAAWGSAATIIDVFRK